MRNDRFLEWKVRIFSVSAVLGLVGIYFDERWMTGGAIVLLFGAILLQFLPGGGGGVLYAENGGDEAEPSATGPEGMENPGSGTKDG